MYKEEGCVKREEYMYKGVRGVCIKDGDIYKGEGYV